MAIDLRPFHRGLGGTGIVVSPLGLGTVKLGRDLGVKYPTPVRIPDDAEAIDLLRRALELGITLIDTAPAYGPAEERLGALLPRVAPRSAWVVCTKVGEEFHAGASAYDFTPPAIRRSVERSLSRLRTDTLDVVLVHSDGTVERRAELDDAFDELDRLKGAGLVRAFGASVKTELGARRTMARADVVMLTLNPSEPDAAAWITGSRGTGSCGVLVKKPLASGHLVVAPASSDGEAERADAAPAAAMLDAAPLRTGAPDAAMRFIFAHPAVGAAIVGTTSPEHLEDNARAVVEALQR